MNHIYRVVYNTASQTYQAVPEISKGKHKSCAEKTSAAASKSPTFAGKLRALCAALLALTCPFALAAPTGGAVSAGQAAIHQAGNITDIRQSSQNAAINWQNFSIGAHETVNFHQPNAESLTLNRVIGNERSIIDGAMNANGKVFISNPNGMLIGRDAQINVGSLVATTAQISNDDFMNGRYQFTNAKGEIENLGNITVPQGGVVALIAPIVKHSGTITAPKAHTLLASADSFSITLPDNANFAYTLDKGTLQGLVDNGGAILADGGRVVLTAKGVDSVKKSLIKHTGVIEANTVQNKNGVIELLGDLDHTRLDVSGTLKAEAKGADKGGFVETSASQVKIHDSAVVSTKSEQGQTGTWLIDPTDFTIYAGTGDKTDTGMGADTLSGNLGNTDITIQTVNTGSEQGDINVNAPISWSRNKLTLSAHNDIHINANLNGSGTAKLALEYGQGSKDGKYKAVVDGKETTLDNDYYLDKNTPLKDRTVKVNLPEGKNFSVKKGSNGETVVFDVIHQMPEIIKNADGDWESKFTTRNIAFGADMDVGYTKGYDGFAGWQLPKGSHINGGWGRVAGLGHTVKDLSLHSKKDSQDTGLFQNQGDNAVYFQEGNTGYLRDIGVIDINVRSDGMGSHTGGLVGGGWNISNSYATGNVSSTGDFASTGGLMGGGENISNSYATGDVSSAGREAHTGGLVGIGGYISNSYATGDVSSTGEIAHTGGLAGNGRYISNSYATGDVSSAGEHAHTGGLVGVGENISNSYATGNVSSTGEYARTGGLVGNGSPISNSYATGDVSSTGKSAETGGLVGYGNSISNSYATGNVSSAGERAHTGGLVGYGNSISNSYANNTSIKATGKGSAMSGLIGYYYHYYIIGSKDSFFNQDKHPTLPAIGSINGILPAIGSNEIITNVTGKTEAELKQKSTFTDAGWDFDKVWYMNDGSMPKLRAFAQTLTVNPTPTPPTAQTPPTTQTPPTAQTTAGVKAPDLSKIYDGKAVNTVDDLKKLNGWKDNFDADGLTTGDSVKSIFKAGTLTIDETKGDWKGAKDVKEGGYSLYPTGTLKDEYQQKYIIEWNKGVLTINKKPITIAANSYYDGTDTAKIYDKNDKFFGKQIMGFNGIVKGDDVSLKLGAAGTLNSNQAGNTTLKDLGNLALEGASANNYTINKDGSTWTINKRPLEIMLIGEKTYDASNLAKIDKNTKFTQNGLIEADINKIGLGGSVVLKGKDVGVYQAQDTTKFNLTGEASKNYDLKSIQGRWNVLPQPVNIRVNAPAGMKHFEEEDFNIVSPVWGDDKIEVKGYADINTINYGSYLLKPNQYNLKIYGKGSNNYTIGDIVVNIKHSPLNSNHIDKTLPFMNNGKINFLPDTANFGCKIQDCIDVENMRINNIPYSWSKWLVGDKLEDFKQGSMIFELRHPELFQREELANIAIDMKNAIDNADNHIEGYISDIPDNINFGISDGLLWRTGQLSIKEYVRNMMKRNYKQNMFEQTDYLGDKLDNLANEYIAPNSEQERVIKENADFSIEQWKKAQTEKGKFGAAGYFSDVLSTGDRILKVGLAWADVSPGIQAIKDKYSDFSQGGWGTVIDNNHFFAGHAKDVIDIMDKTVKVLESGVSGDMESAGKNVAYAMSSLSKLAVTYRDYVEGQKGAGSNLSKVADTTAKLDDLLSKIDNFNKINKTIEQIKNIPDNLLIPNDKEIIEVILRTQQVSLSTNILSDGIGLLNDTVLNGFIPSSVTGVLSKLSVTTTETLDFAVSSIEKEFAERNNWIKIDEENRTLDNALSGRSEAIRDLLINVGETAISSKQLKNRDAFMFQSYK